MERVMQQVTTLTEELNQLKSEIVNAKAAHASLHQSSVEANNQYVARFNDIEQRLESAVHGTNTTNNKKHLMEPKNVTVDVFSGSITDSRLKF